VLRALKKKNFSSKVAKQLLRRHRKSTGAIYNSKWKLFHLWCNRRHKSAIDTDVQSIARFLLWLFTKKHLKPSTIAGYRAAISQTYRYVNPDMDIGNNVYLSDLIKSFYLDTPKSVYDVPKWDLNLVLSMLCIDRFEPITEISLKNLTLKTVFSLVLVRQLKLVKFIAWHIVN